MTAPIAGGLPRPITITSPPPGGTGAPADAARAPDQQTKLGQGALEGRQVAVGNGEARSQTMARPAHPMQPPPIAHKAFEGLPKQQFAAMTQPLPGGLAARAAVMDRLEQHAQAQGTSLGRDELRQMVALGERIAGALTHGEVDANNPGQLTLDVGDGQMVTVSSNTATTRALAWFMMAGAANQDAVREAMGDASGTSDMVTNGSFLMKDEGNRVFNFMSAAQTCTARISTHFNERADHAHVHTGLIGKGQPVQQGIEDFSNLMPGQGGAMLFDKVKGAGGSQELFVKIEQVGCPALFRKEAHEGGVGKSISRFFSAIGRNIKHTLNFLNTRSQGAAGGAEVRRQEHVFKGVLKESVAKPFAELMDSARQAGLVGEDAKAIGKSIKKLGLPFLMETLAQVHQQASREGNMGLVGQVEGLYAQIDNEMTRLGLASDQHGVARRGAEVHISLDPARQADPAATALSADAVRMSAAKSLGRTLPAQGLGGVQAEIAKPLSQTETRPAGTAGASALVSDQFRKDLMRASYVIGDQVFEQQGDADEAAHLEAAANAVLAQCGGNAAQAMAVSCMASQMTLAAISGAQARGEMPAEGDLAQVLPGQSGSAQTRYVVTPQSDGAVLVHIDHHDPRMADAIDVTTGQGASLDPQQSSYHVRFAVRIGAEDPPTRTLVALDGSNADPAVHYDLRAYSDPAAP